MSFGRNFRQQVRYGKSIREEYKSYGIFTGRRLMLPEIGHFSGRYFRWQVYYGKMLREKYISSGRTEYFPVGNATGKKTGLPVGISAQRSTTGKSYRKWLREIISAYR
jgi:hypothetical protein